MSEKGQQIIDVAISAFVGLIVLSLLIGMLWPLVNNFMVLAENTPNYLLWSPIANFVPAILFLIFIVWILRAASGQTQQRQVI